MLSSCAVHMLVIGSLSECRVWCCSEGTGPSKIVSITCATPPTDGGRCCVHTGHLPRNLACLTSLAISIVHLEGGFDYLPEAHRHNTGRLEESVQILKPAAR